MASRRKTYVRTKPDHTQAPRSEAVEHACFLNDLLDGTIQATALHEVRDGRGRLIRIEYDDPDGASGSAGGGGGTRRDNVIARGEQ